MSTTKTTHKIFVRKKSKFIDDEAVVSDDSSDESSRSESDNNYDFDDDFLVADSDVEESKDMTKEESKDVLSIEIERRRAEMALDEVAQCNNRIKTLERKLQEMKKLKLRWQQRAKMWKKRAVKFLVGQFLRYTLDMVHFQNLYIR